MTRITWYFHKIRRVLISHIKLVDAEGGGGRVHTVSSILIYVRGYRNSSVKKVRVNKQPGLSLITSYMYTHQLFSGNDKSNYLVNVLNLSKTCCNFTKITYNVTYYTNKVQTKDGKTFTDQYKWSKIQMMCLMRIEWRVPRQNTSMGFLFFYKYRRSFAWILKSHLYRKMLATTLVLSVALYHVTAECPHELDLEKWSDSNTWNGSVSCSLLLIKVFKSYESCYLLVYKALNCSYTFPMRTVKAQYS